MGSAACGGRSHVSHGPNGTIGVLAFHSTWRDGSPVKSGGLSYPTDIYTVDVARRRVRNLTRDERTEYCWSWLPHGRAILYASAPSDRMKRGQKSIDLVSVDGTAAHHLVSGRGDVCPSSSPDGQRILYTIDGGSNRGLYVMRSDGT